jgi:benzoyl-CoA reductase/2-hydroxyglutaryl-CoA dehydratase subunit BcrC/BadD/HgdB
LDCNQREELADERLAQLHQRRTALPFTDFDFYRLIRSREYLPAETFVELAEGSLAQAADIKRGGIPVVLSGIVPEPMNVLESISELGGRIVADDFACCGRRLYPRGTSDDPFRRMAERIVYAPPDPTRGNSIQERLDHLLGLVRSNEAKGVIFYEVKFCEPELFDLPNLRKGLQEAHIPSLVVEVDINDPLSHQVRTRLEAFLEIL